MCLCICKTGKGLQQGLGAGRSSQLVKQQPWTAAAAAALPCTSCASPAPRYETLHICTFADKKLFARDCFTCCSTSTVIILPRVFLSGPLHWFNLEICAFACALEAMLQLSPSHSKLCYRLTDTRPWTAFLMFRLLIVATDTKDGVGMTFVTLF